ncbi:MAG: UDP-N-acetylglucosamine 2-epimerase (non-hydrolyzing) [Gemmatimonadota bacterium]
MSVQDGRPRVLTVVGTRPEAIKMAPVIQALEARGSEVETVVALTGQHTTMVDQVLEVFGYAPQFDLELMRQDQTLYDVATGCLDGLRRVVQEVRPHALVVQGDTATVFFGALVSFFERVRVGHVEAGLRSHDKWAPYPEEIFRRLTDVVTDFYFAPTAGAQNNLLAEDVAPEQVHVTGNTVVDALQHVAASDRKARHPDVQRLLAAGRPLVLLTAHRRESFGAPLEGVFRVLRQLADQHTGVEFLYPVHPNPNVQEPARRLLSDHPRIHLTDPLDYVDLVRVLERATLVLTDSGGIQEEAPTFGTPVLVLREVTERPEGLAAGAAVLVGTDPARIRREVSRVIDGGPGHRRTSSNPYGDGRAGERIADIIVSSLTGSARRTGDWLGP